MCVCVRDSIECISEWTLPFHVKDVVALLQYIVERHGKTLLPQYLGMYRLTVDGVEHYVVAIRNVFSNHLTTHKKFDLKGSTVDREASDKEKEKDLPTYKDNDFVKEGMKIYIGEEAKAKLLETLTADVDVSIFVHIEKWSARPGYTYTRV